MEGWTRIRGGAAYADVCDRTFRPSLKQGLKHVRLRTGTILIKYAWIDEFLEAFTVDNNQADRLVSQIEQEIKAVK